MNNDIAKKNLQKLETIGFKGSVKKSTSRIQDIAKIDQGYNSTARIKEKGFSNAYCQVLNTTMPTNFLVIASDGTQISDNKILTKEKGFGMLRYYSRDHEGAVRLRVNSGSTTVGYAVTGEWNPNGVIFSP